MICAIFISELYPVVTDVFYCLDGKKLEVYIPKRKTENIIIYLLENNYSVNGGLGVKMTDL